MNAPKRRSNHLELVRPTEADVAAALYAGRLLERAENTPVMPKGHVKALAVMFGATGGVLLAALVLILVRWFQ